MDLFAAGLCLWCILHGGDHPFMIGSQLNVHALLQGKPQFSAVSGIAFWGGSAWSARAQEFCDALTDRNRTVRLTAQKALQHPWFGDWEAKISRNTRVPAKSPGQMAAQPLAVGSAAAGLSGGASAAGGPSSAGLNNLNLNQSPYEGGAKGAYGGAGGSPTYGGLYPTPLDDTHVKRKEELANITEQNQKLQKQMEDLTEREANEKKAMEERIKQLEEQVKSGDAAVGGNEKTAGADVSGIRKSIAGMLQAGFSMFGQQGAFGGGPGGAYGGQFGVNGAQQTQHALIGNDGGAPRPVSAPSASDSESMGNQYRGGFGYDSSPSRSSSRQAVGGGATSSTSSPTRKLLSEGVRVCYKSSSHDAWFAGTVKGHNLDDGTYELDLKTRAPVERIAPPFERDKNLAWPVGVLVTYWSETTRAWLNAVRAEKLMFYEEDEDKEAEFVGEEDDHSEKV